MAREKPPRPDAGATFDAGGLIALEKRNRKVLALIARANDAGVRLTVPATALAQAVRAPVRQVHLSRLVRQPTTEVVPLDRVDATKVGLLLASSASDDVVDAHVVICAQRTNQRVVTSDADDLLRIDPSLKVLRV